MTKPIKEWKPCHYYFGERTWYSNFHLGQDFDVNYINVIAHTNGEIVQSGTGNQSGRYVILRDSKGNYVRHLHLSKIVVPRGTVKEGQVIAVTGNTGLSKAPHLHIDVWKVPFAQGYAMALKGDYSALIDPLKYFIDDNKTTMEKLQEMANTTMANARAFVVVVNDAKGEKWFIKDNKKEKINTEKAMEEAEFSAHPQKLFVEWGMIAGLEEAKWLHNN